MRYKTMVLGLLEQRPRMHEQLRRQKMLLKTMEFYASELKTLHEAWKEQLTQARPGSDPTQIASIALEIALKELEDGLPSDSSSEDSDPLSLDAAMAFIRKHMPTE